MRSAISFKNSKFFS